MNAARPPPTRASTSPFAVGPAVLRAPPAVAVPAAARGPALDVEPRGEHDTDEMLGDLVDMVFVGADDAEVEGHAEVHLVFKAEVLGGLHLRLKKMVDGMHATFVVEDAAARRAVVDHVDGLIAHLRSRGFTIASHRVELSP
jgi:hypothetical protein